jgi:hypothetical protein
VSRGVAGSGSTSSEKGERRRCGSRRLPSFGEKGERSSGDKGERRFAEKGKRRTAMALGRGGWGKERKRKGRRKKEIRWAWDPPQTRVKC